MLRTERVMLNKERKEEKELYICNIYINSLEEIVLNREPNLLNEESEHSILRGKIGY